MDDADAYASERDVLATSNAFRSASTYVTCCWRLAQSNATAKSDDAVQSLYDATLDAFKSYVRARLST